MFSAIAPRYDLLNHLLSLNIDRVWRHRAVERLNWRARPDGLFLDACCGTYDLGLELAQRPDFRGRVIAFDFSQAMLKEGRDKISRHEVTPLCADALHLPLASQAFDGALIAFGLRNLVSIDAGLEELRRVLRRGGGLVILDFSMPKRAPLKWLYHLYFTRLLPVIGRWISKHSQAYSYLPESVMGFPQPSVLARRLEDAGFSGVDWRPLTGGIACLWCAEA